jgi:hypothetical protein
LEVNTDAIYTPPSESHPGWEDENDILRGNYIPSGASQARYGNAAAIPDFLTVVNNYANMEHPKLISRGDRMYVYNDPDAGYASRGIADPLDWVTIGFHGYGGPYQVQQDCVWYGKSYRAGDFIYRDYIAVRAPYLFALSTIAAEQCEWFSRHSKYPIEIAVKMASEDTDNNAGWLSNDWLGVSEWEKTDAYLYMAQRNPLQNGEHTAAMCTAGGRDPTPYLPDPEYYYRGCKCDVVGRMSVNFSHANYKREITNYPYRTYRWFARGSQTPRSIFACKPPPSSIIPAIVGMGALTLISLLGPVLGAAAASAGAGAGRRTPRRKS